MAGKLSEGEKEMIQSVCSFFQLERARGQRLQLSKVVQRTAQACGVSERTVKRCRRLAQGRRYREGRDDDEAGPSGAAGPGPGRPKIEVDEFMKTAIRNVVHSFYRERVYPNLHMIWVRCRASVKDFPDMSETTLWRTLRSMKFAYRKRRGEGRKLVCERLDIVAWRHRFLRRLRQAKEDARPVVYLDETWVNAHHALCHTWYD